MIEIERYTDDKLSIWNQFNKVEPPGSRPGSQVGKG